MEAGGTPHLFFGAGYFFLAQVMDAKSPSKESIEERVSKLKQHRCHPRAADLVHVIMGVQVTLIPARLSLLTSCLASTPGEEPKDPFILDPTSHAIRLKRNTPVAPK